MYTPTPKYRKQLNDDQINVLKLLFKFRFGSSDLLARSIGKKQSADIYRRLRILQDQGLIARRYEPGYKLLGRPAAYYLTPDGARALHEYDPKLMPNIKAIYKDKAVSEAFVQYCLDVFGLYRKLHDIHGNELRFFTRSQLIKYDYFEEFVPNVYLRINQGGTEHDFFLEYLQSSKPFFAALQRLKQYVKYADSGEWEAGTDSDFPAMLFVCDSRKLLNRLREKADWALDEADDELGFYATTLGKLDVWQSLTDEDEKSHTLLAI